MTLCVSGFHCYNIAFNSLNPYISCKIRYTFHIWIFCYMTWCETLWLGMLLQYKCKNDSARLLTVYCYMLPFHYLAIGHDLHVTHMRQSGFVSRTSESFYSQIKPPKFLCSCKSRCQISHLYSKNFGAQLQNILGILALFKLK